jgi:O-antigen/teichoic acid export membrane protein
MTPTSVGVARGILRNAGALFLVGLFAKGAGLVIAVLVARFLGADAMGLFAVLFSVSVLIEAFISFGMSDSLVRDVAARPADSPGMFLGALKLVAVISALPMAGLLAAAGFYADQPAARDCLVILAFGTPVSGAFVVAQAVLQGSERVLLLVWVTFIARVLSLAFLAWVFFEGAGIAAAFLSRILFHLLSLIVLAYVILKGRDRGATAHSTRHLLDRAAPFAVNKAIRELGMRLPALVLPGSLGLASSGVFDSANRLRSTLGLTMSASITGLMPAFARSGGEQEERAATLIGFSLKYMCVGMSLVATGITVLAAWIVHLLYGPEFAEAALPLQLLAWAQVLTAVDAVLQQAMLARQAVLPAIRHSAIGVAAQGILLVSLSWIFGLAGAAAAVLFASATTLAIDLRYVVRRVTHIPVWRFAGAPLLAALCAAVLRFASDGLPLLLRALIAVGAWVGAVASFRIFPRDELRFMWQLVAATRSKRSKGS